MGKSTVEKKPKEERRYLSLRVELWKKIDDLADANFCTWYEQTRDMLVDQLHEIEQPNETFGRQQAIVAEELAALRRLIQTQARESSKESENPSG